MQKVIILKGLPASGKSTYAKEIIEKNPGVYKRINKDDLRSMLDNSKWSKSNEAFVLKVRDALINLALAEGYSPIVDDTNLHSKHEDSISAMVAPIPVETKSFDVPVFECIERDAKRPNPVGGEVIVRMWNQFVKKDVLVDESLPSAIICDIDGTIAKMNGRSPYDWSKVDTDLPKKEVISIISALGRTHKVILMSGRDGSVLEKTEKWLNDNNIYYDALYMRAPGDTRKDFVIKKELYEAEIEGKYRVQFVLDDRNQIVDMWRGLGLTCLQVDYGNF